MKMSLGLASAEGLLRDLVQEEHGEVSDTKPTEDQNRIIPKLKTQVADLQDRIVDSKLYYDNAQIAHDEQYARQLALAMGDGDGGNSNSR